MSKGSRRLKTGGEIDRSQIINFEFNGTQYQGCQGDSLASALMANNVSLTARSFKYHRPRGIMGANSEEPASYVELLGDAASGSQPITTIVLREGLRAKAVNCWPTPSFDLMSVNQLIKNFIPAGFYYKTLMWPNWHFFEPHIRRIAGLAKAPERAPMSGQYESRYWFCDVLIVGAGPAGLMAALTVARSGARIVLVDDGSLPGGDLLNTKELLNGQPSKIWVNNVIDELDNLKNVLRLQESSAWAYREQNLVIVTERHPAPKQLIQRTWRIRARRVIIASGAIERTLVFKNNDRPGVMLASAVQAYINRYATLPGKRAVIFTNNDSAYQVAEDMIAAGIEIAAIVDCRKDPAPTHASPTGDIVHKTNHVVTKVVGRRRVRAVNLRSNATGDIKTIACDLLCVSGGWNPTVHLFSQARGSLRYEDSLSTFVPDTPAQANVCIGAAAGKFGLQEIFADALEAGHRAAIDCGFKILELSAPIAQTSAPYSIEALWHSNSDDLSASSFVDIQNDVTLHDVHLAIREGFGAIEHVKRYTTGGMGIDQGKTGNINIIGAVANQMNVALAEIGTTTYRSPFVPIELGAIAGGREDSAVLPYRHTPITQWHKDYGATMYESGAHWRRPGYYAKVGESLQQTINREALATRENLAIYDGSPLGKFEISGQDAIKLIEMLYTNQFSNLKVGMGRYGVMLTEDGRILDDGVTFKLHDDHYLMSTSTANAQTVYRHIQRFLQIERPEWRVWITPLTTQWSNATLCGPKARQVLSQLNSDIDFSSHAFPFMGLREGTIEGIKTRVCRVSFTGELSFEINVRSRDALKLWERLFEIGKPLDLVPIGSEANHVLRVEKGFLSLGHEVDGTADPYDLGMSWVMSKQKADYIGKRAVKVRRGQNRARRELVGLLTDDPSRLVTEGAPLTPDGKLEASEGFVTASVWSVARSRSVALALLADGRNRIGQKAYVRIKNDVIPVTITQPCFYDADSELMRS